jgi:DNA-directed RNA polymerase subunit RPC12/RpoP
MTGEASLSGLQRRRAAQIARERDLSCPECGSSAPAPKDEARGRADGGADVAMRCEDCESAVEITLVLSPEEARALGLHSLNDNPQAP